MVLSTDPEIMVLPDSSTSVGVFVVSNAAVKKDSVLLYYSTNGGATFATPLPMTLAVVVDSSTNSGMYTAIIPKQSAGTAVKFYVFAVDTTNKSRITKVEGRPPVPTTFKLYQNYPNPFNPSTIIQYTLDRPNHTTLKVYDLLGREVATLVDEYQTAGLKPPVHFDASRLASGVYLYRLKSGEFSAVNKLVFLK
jgi:hypothetical protein